LIVSDVMQTTPRGTGGIGAGRILLEEGVDLLAADLAGLKRGTPVYVSADADVNDVQRRMAMKHIKLLPVLKDGDVVGLVDLVDLVRMQSEDGSGDVLGRPA
jgi:CBS domain-containing protein